MLGLKFSERLEYGKFKIKLLHSGHPHARELHSIYLFIPKMILDKEAAITVTTVMKIQ